jgi:hypothetical protein
VHCARPRFPASHQKHKSTLIGIHVYSHRGDSTTYSTNWLRSAIHTCTCAKRRARVMKTDPEKSSTKYPNRLFELTD